MGKKYGMHIVYVSKTTLVMTVIAVICWWERLFESNSDWHARLKAKAFFCVDAVIALGSCGGKLKVQYFSSPVYSGWGNFVFEYFRKRFSVGCSWLFVVCRVLAIHSNIPVLNQSNFFKHPSCFIEYITFISVRDGDTTTYFCSCS